MFSPQSAGRGFAKRINATGSSRNKENRTPEGRETLRLRKGNQPLRMKNDVIQQAALIFARKAS